MKDCLMNKLSDRAFLGAGQTLLLRVDTGGTYIVDGAVFNVWEINMQAPAMGAYAGQDGLVERSFDYDHVIIQGHISFSASKCAYKERDIASGPLIGEYTITDMLRIIRQKIKER